MSRKELGAYVRLTGILLGRMPAMVIACVLEGLLGGVTPMVYVFLTSAVLDGVSRGEGAESLIGRALVGILVMFLIHALYGVSERMVNRRLEYILEQQNRPVSEKSMQLLFETLDNPDIHRERDAITGRFSRFGVLGMVLDGIIHLCANLIVIVSACVLVVPPLRSAAALAVGFPGSYACTFLFLLLILLICIANTHFVHREYRTMSEKYDADIAPLDTVRKYYLRLFATTDTQKDIRVNGLEATVEREVKRNREAFGRLRKWFLSRNLRRGTCFQGIANLAMILAYLFSAWYGFMGLITLGSAVRFIESVRHVSECMFRLGDSLSQIGYSGMYAIKLLDFMELDLPREGTIPVEKRQDDRFSVSFEHVYFRYPGREDWALEDVTVQVEIGERMALVGRNGSGKTTFIKLLCGLYEVTSGVIRVNGIDIRKYDPKEYMALFGVVFQDFCLPDFRLGEIVSCEEGWEEERLRDAVSRVGLTERMESLQRGADTPIGKGFYGEGENLSGGERQKLAMARAVYRNAAFVILDEPTAALDPEAECQVFAGFDRMVGQKTALYISHRLASCRFCEDILVFDRGRLVQRGSHEQLSGKSGLYREMWTAQARYYEPSQEFSDKARTMP